MREAFILPDRECERATRREMDVCKLLSVLTSEVMYGQKDLQKRLAIIPDGESRMAEALENIKSIYQDIIGTINTRQAKQLMNASNDLKFQLIPKLSPDLAKFQLNKEEFRELIDCAREKCKFCTEDGENCTKCKLYGIMIERIPLEEYGDGIVCPYAYTEWM